MQTLNVVRVVLNKEDLGNFGVRVDRDGLLELDAEESVLHFRI
jgi:hypothetical protein